ncbi:hypothetical protein [Empedobacter tilapiae]|uniref:Uncharacterized protein n=1 Tax=Empedobacter tilapiae TaxID=2491114 RepID=A0A4Z1BVK1_9FLAO|nr:hypothetical protein [Empedobacter tilapiae]TGN26455.1 hypothetical protein E4J94_11555 [Empedobacter tilapiae]
MLTSFNEIDHPIYTFHDHIYHIFRNIFYYDLQFYDEQKLVHRDFRSCVNSSKKRLLNPLKEIVILYHQLPYLEKLKLQEALVINNDISIFNDCTRDLISFKEIHPSISNKLKVFFESLWSDYPQNNEIEDKFGTVKDHYDKLIHEDNFDFLICPFCGLNKFEPSEALYREEYDHLLAKASYPFVAVNFKLLFPCCKKCNQQEKKKKDPLYEIIDPLYKEIKTRRLAHYPYDPSIKLDFLSIQIILKNQYNNENLKTLLKYVEWDIKILRNEVHDDRDEAWDEIYGIKRQFSEHLKSLQNYCFSELILEYKTNIKPFDDFSKDYITRLKTQINYVPMGIVRYIYFTFIFSIPDIEEKLQQVIAT